MARNQRAGRRRGQRARPMWLEIGGQQRLRRLHAGLQVRRQRLQAWSDRVDELDDRIADRLHGQGTEPRASASGESRAERPGRTVRDRIGYYDTGGEDVSAPGKEIRPAIRRSTEESSEETDRPRIRSEAALRPIPRRRPVTFDLGYDAGADDVTGARIPLRRADQEDGQEKPAKKASPSRSSGSRSTRSRKTSATKKSSKRSATRKRSSS